MMARISDHDRFVGAQLRVIQAFGLRRKEAVMLKPFEAVVSSASSVESGAEGPAQHPVRIEAGAKGGRKRFIPIDRPERVAAIELAQAVAVHRDGHLGNPKKNLAQNLNHFNYILAKFGPKYKELGATAHGLRHQALTDEYEAVSGFLSPVRGGGEVPAEIDKAARRHVAALAGHSRPKVAAAYLGAVMGKRKPTTVKTAEQKGDELEDHRDGG
jgi:integrase